MKRNKKIFIIAVISFLVLNTINTFFATTTFLNRYLVPFKRVFLGELNAVIGNLLILLIILVIILFATRKYLVRIRSLMLVTLFLNLAVYGLSVYVKFYSVAFEFSSLELLRNPGDGLGLSLVFQAFKDLIFEYRILIFIPFAAIFGLLLAYNRKEDIIIKAPRFLMLKRGLNIATLIVIGLIVNMVIFNQKFDKTWNTNVARTTYVAQNLGVYPYYIYQLTGYEFKVDPMKEYSYEETAELVEYFNTNKETYTNIIDGKEYSNVLTTNNLSSDINIDPSLLNEDGNLTGILEGKNLVLIHLESFSFYLYSLFEDQWPFLQALLEESYEFENFYNNVGIGTSADAEFSVLTGLYSTGDTTLYWDYEKNQFVVDSLPALFNEKDYYTQAIHGDVPEFYNRNQVYPELMQFDDFYSLEDFNRDYPNLNQKYNHPNPWVSDFGLAEYTKYQMNQINGNYMLFPMTMMPHIPFAHDPYETKSKAAFEKYDWYQSIDNTTKKYLHYIEYYDEVIESFFFNKETNQNEIDTNTVYIFYGDHTANINSEDLKLIFGNKDMNRMELYQHNLKTKAWIYVPGTTINENGINEGLITGKQSLVRSQIDIYRSVVELFNLKTDNPYFGIHLFSNEPGYCISSRFFGIAANTCSDGKNGCGEAFFLLGDYDNAIGDVESLKNDFTSYVMTKKTIVDIYVQTSMLTDLSKWDD